MIGYHAVPVIADAYMKGIRGFDAKEALEAMVASASYGPYDGLKQYMELGYVPIDEEDEAALSEIEEFVRVAALLMHGDCVLAAAHRQSLH